MSVNLFYHLFLFPFVLYYIEIHLQSQLAAVRQRDLSHAVHTRNRFRIRRDHILEDAFSQLNALSEEDLRGPVLLQLICLYIVYLYILMCV